MGQAASPRGTIEVLAERPSGSALREAVRRMRYGPPYAIRFEGENGQPVEQLDMLHAARVGRAVNERERKRCTVIYRRIQNRAYEIQVSQEMRDEWLRSPERREFASLVPRAQDDWLSDTDTGEGRSAGGYIAEWDSDMEEVRSPVQSPASEEQPPEGQPDCVMGGELGTFDVASTGYISEDTDPEMPETESINSNQEQLYPEPNTDHA